MDMIRRAFCWLFCFLSLAGAANAQPVVDQFELSGRAMRDATVPLPEDPFPGFQIVRAIRLYKSNAAEAAVRYWDGLIRMSLMGASCDDPRGRQFTSIWIMGVQSGFPEIDLAMSEPKLKAAAFEALLSSDRLTPGGAPTGLCEVSTRSRNKAASEIRAQVETALVELRRLRDDPAYALAKKQEAEEPLCRAGSAAPIPRPKGGFAYTASCHGAVEGHLYGFNVAIVDDGSAIPIGETRWYPQILSTQNGDIEYIVRTINRPDRAEISIYRQISGGFSLIEKFHTDSDRFSIKTGDGCSAILLDKGGGVLGQEMYLYRPGSYPSISKPIPIRSILLWSGVDKAFIVRTETGQDNGMFGLVSCEGEIRPTATKPWMLEGHTYTSGARSPWVAMMTNSQLALIDLRKQSVLRKSLAPAGETLKGATVSDSGAVVIVATDRALHAYRTDDWTQTAKWPLRSCSDPLNAISVGSDDRIIAIADCGYIFTFVFGNPNPIAIEPKAALPRYVRERALAMPLN